jgi:PAS domain S-box-containing protein
LFPLTAQKLGENKVSLLGSNPKRGIQSQGTGLLVADPDTFRLVFANQGACRILETSKEQLFTSSESLFPTLGIEPSDLADGTAFQRTIKKTDGEITPLEIAVESLEVSGVRRLLVILTEQRDVSKRLPGYFDKDRFFSLCLEMLCIADTTGFFLCVNPAFTAVLGYSQEDLVSRPFIDFVHPDDVAATERALQRASSGELVGFENRYRRVDDTFRTLNWTSMLDPATGTIYAAARDVTEERERQQELAEKNHRLEMAGSLDRAARRSLLIFSQRRSIDDALDEVLTVLDEELNLRPLAFYTLDEPSGTLKFSAGLCLAPNQSQTLQIGVGLVGEAASTQVPILIDAKDDLPEVHTLPLEMGFGQICPRAFFAIPLVHHERTLAVLTGASQETLSSTEWSALQQLASQSAAGLYALEQFEQLRKLTVQLNERGTRIAHQNRELKKASRLKSAFLANMSHELRTPLNAIIGFSELLKDGMLGRLEENQADYCSEIFSSGHHLLSLINDILDLSKIEAGMMELCLENTDVESVIANSISIIREQANKKSLRIEHDFEPQLGLVSLDERKFRQVIYNLLSNAVKFTEQEGTISIKAILQNEELVVCVEDTGIGISAEDQRRLFEPFIQIDGDLDRKYEGTGLGLGLVKKLVELHQGSVELWSEVGVGSRFTVRIPHLSEAE